MKICSLIPSGTEILFALGLGDHVAAVTQFCDYPAEARSRPVVSRARVDTAVLTAREAADITNALAQSGQGTYVFDVEWLYREKPNLILTQDLCRVCDLEASRVMQAIVSLQPPPEVLVLSPKNLADILNNINRVGKATGAAVKAEALRHQIECRIEEIASRTALAERRPRVFVIEWLEPLAAGGHWMPEMVKLVGGEDRLGRPNEPSVLLEWEQVLSYDPEIIIMTPCSCPIQRTLRDVHHLARQPGWWDIRAVRDGEVYIVNSDYFVRPGPRVVQGLEIMAQLIHPELFENLIPAKSVAKLDRLAREDASPEKLARYFHEFAS